MDRSTLILAFHGLVGLIWYAFGTVGLRTTNFSQAGLGFVTGTVIVLVGYFVSKRYVDD